MQSTLLLNTTSGKFNVTGEPQKGAGYSNTIGNNHTVSITLNNFTGRIYIEGSLSVDPAESDWFAIALEDGLPYVQFPKNIIKPVGPLNAYGTATGDTGSFAYNFTGNFIWLRARVDRTYLVPPPTDPDRVGSVTKILLNYGAVSPGSSNISKPIVSSGGVAGPQGPIGPTGPQGEPSIVTGPTGSQGFQGVQGQIGPTGLQGIQGVQGDTGPTGVQGEASTVTGPTGAQGEIGHTGPTGSGLSAGGATGAIQYNDGQGAVTGDETSLFYDSTNKRLSVGTNDTSVGALHVVGTLPAVFNTNSGSEHQIIIGTGIGGTSINWNESINLSTIGLVENTNILSINGSGIGIRGVTPLNSLDVSGGVVIGSGIAYAGSTVAPLNGLIVQGSVGVGTTSPDTEKMFINGGNAVFSNKVGIGTNTSASIQEGNSAAIFGNLTVTGKIYAYNGIEGASSGATGPTGPAGQVGPTGPAIGTGDIGIVGNEVSSSTGLIISNGNLIAASTAALILPPNGSGDLEIINNTGNVIVTAENNILSSTWILNYSGSVIFPDGTGQTTAFTTNPTLGILSINEGVLERFQSKADATGIVSHDCSLGHIFYHTSPDANWTANFVNMNLNSGYATTVTLIISQGATGYYPNNIQIDNVAQTINWQGNATPTPSTNRTDAVTFSVINNSGTYVVLGQLTGF